jgi:predicted Rossmann fold nucleotide-binding protein DprA/Smf involved in DNA uptake
MAQTETLQVKVQIDVDGMHYEAIGTAEEIFSQVMQFLIRAVPAYDVAKKLVYVPDLAGIADVVGEFARMTTTGQLLLTRTDLPAEKAITILLFMAQLAGKMGKREADSLSIEEIATGVGRAPKTIRNVLVQLQRVGHIDRVDRGRYRITTKGLLELEHDSLNLSKEATHA